MFASRSGFGLEEVAEDVTEDEALLLLLVGVVLAVALIWARRSLFGELAKLARAGAI